ncbi:T9SS type B sorting domain-containing protein [uncultured Kordia sp.]|uniref:T9SS type B sorting domain-containing protein n=1 Tax=uncultured Kordia sp. TaxID=507699 RepID=UPI002636ED65|nr:T9SS type B sorting domain-containing protein [uncultured Kordia sp.]
MHKTKVFLIVVLGILSLSVSSNHKTNSTETSAAMMMDPIEYVICDEDGFSELNILDIQNDILSNYDGATIEAAVVICTSTGHIIQLNNLSGTITTDVICDMPNSLSDIAVDENSVIYATDFNTIFELNQTGCTTISLPNLGSIPSTNSLSFDTQGNLYYGGFNSGSVYRYDSDESGPAYVWHNFVNGAPSGDFVVLDGKMYISWNISGQVRLYEVTIDSDFNYVSHIDLGQIPGGTFGLASELGTLYGVSTNELYEIDLDTFTFTTVLNNNSQYGSWYGAAGLHEAFDYEVSSYTSNDDATNAENPLPDTWTNTQQGGQTIYIRVENTLTGTFEIIEVDIVIYDNIPDLTTPTNLADCDTNGNPMFTITDVEMELLQNVAHSVTVTYHASQANADDNINPLSTSYELTTAQETIYVRVQNDDNECYSTTQFNVLLSTSPMIETPSDLFQCVDQGSDTFTLTDVETELLQNNTNAVTVSYHTLLTDAEMGMNPIATNYQILPGQETIFVRVENNDNNCFATTQFNINLGGSIQINTPDDIIQCQGVNNDIFNLTEVETTVLANTTQTVTVSYYTSLANAEASTNAISTNYSPSANQETIYVRVDDTNNDCFAITDFEITINQGLGITTPSNLIQCEGENNNIFDLTLVETEVLQNVTQTATVTYHTSLVDATDNTNEIDPNYSLTTNQATLYIRAENTSNGCYETTQFTVQIIANPQVPQFVNTPSARLLTDCYIDSNTNGYFNLNDIYNEVVLDGNTNYTLIFYLTENNAEANIGAINPIFFANSGLQEIFVAVSNDVGCRSISNFYVDPDCYDTIVDITNIYFPQFFTPNNDFANDTWNVRGISVAVQQTAIMYIFDRYGKLIYYFRPGQTEGWDGTYRGKQMPSNEYWYKMEMADGFAFKGSFSLVR